MRLNEFMTKSFDVLKPDCTLIEAVSLMRNTRSEGLPVVDSNGDPIGVFTKNMFIDAVIKGDSCERTIEQIYSRNFVKFSEHMPYEAIREIVENSQVGMGLVLNEKEKVVGLLTKAQMVLAAFRRENSLKTRLQAIYDAMHNAIIFISSSGKVSYINKSAEKFFDMRLSEIYGSSVNDCFPGMFNIELTRECKIEIGKKYTYKNIKFLYNITSIFEKDEYVGSIAVLQDITELDSIAYELESVKMLNMTLQTVLDTAHDGIAVLNQYGDITYVNNALANVTESSDCELMGKPIKSVLQNIDIDETLRTGKSKISDVKTKSGRLYKIYVLPVIRKNKMVGAVLKIIRNQIDSIEKVIEINTELTFSSKTDRKSRNDNSLCDFNNIISSNAEIKKLKEQAQQVARGKSTVLILGESGTGKELFAQAIHMASLRSKKPFVAVNCAAIPENLLESEFFGYVSGAFTGATRNGKKGKFELADGGTIFLDEIGDMPLSLQVKLLRIIQNKSVERLGSNETISVDVRIIAATNHDLEVQIRQGLFREDFYYRLNVIQLKIPPLRDRSEDIPQLAYHFIDKYNHMFSSEIRDISSEAFFCLQNYKWPGNVRELENVIERAMNFSDSGIISLENLPTHIINNIGYKYDNRRQDVNNLNSKRNETDITMILNALKMVNGNKSQAASILGISRSWLYKKMDLLGIDEKSVFSLTSSQPDAGKG